MSTVTNHQKMIEGMQEALKGGATLQATIREVFKECTGAPDLDNVINDVASAVQVFKNHGMHSIPPSVETDVVLKAKYVKKMDNVINDVARLCREFLGYTIVCTKRGSLKSGKVWEYQPQMPAPRATKAPAPAALICTGHHFDSSIHMHIPTSTEEYLNMLRNLCPSDMVNRIAVLDPGHTLNVNGWIEFAKINGATLMDLGKAIAQAIREEKENSNG